MNHLRVTLEQWRTLQAVIDYRKGRASHSQLIEILRENCNTTNTMREEACGVN
ncbi:MAG: hypothetical protein L3J89_04205 [Gammaproteobacteria bacterium]|nr:hypothetical protein [Gammaproteobacteria bacterium]